MKYQYTISVLLLIGTVMISAFIRFTKMPRVLVFSKTSGYHHQSIPDGIAAIQKLGKEQGFAVDTTTDSTQFNERNLHNYKAVVFLSTTGNVLGTKEEKAFQEYITGGGGLIGIHAATDTEYDWPWYGQAIGAWFLSHPKQQQATLHIVDGSHPSTRGLPQSWTRWDEWYNFKSINPDLHVLITIDETSYEGGKNGAGHPVAWYRKEGKGTVFYTALGHTAESYSEPAFLKHLAGGIQYVLQQEN
ncbi:MAG TPA: ThuA domain-containing protein [Flavisolibacter sp.]|jgi:type 1 glutamine amidotransferase|nr:ThuA domain-containing protein [Flavisolibacter sp.]